MLAHTHAVADERNHMTKILKISFAEKILNEERDERLFAKMEQQISKSEMSLKGMNDRDRSWFQTMKQRKTERDRLDAEFKAKETTKSAASETGGKSKGATDVSKLSESKRKKKELAERKASTSNKHPSQLAKQRYIQTKERSSLLRAKAVKTAHKPKRVHSIEDNVVEKRSVRNKRESKFSVDLTNTGRRGAKRLRFVLFYYYYFFAFCTHSSFGEFRDNFFVCFFFVICHSTDTRPIRSRRHKN